MSKLIAVEGDYDTQDCCYHGGITCTGDGNYNITPVNKQGFVYINGKLVVVKGEDFNTHSGGSCEGFAAQSSGGSSFIFINGMPVARENDISESESCHTFSGIAVTNQNFVYEGT